MSEPDEPVLPPDEVLEAAGWVKRSRRERRIDSTPRLGQCFWIDFPHDAYAPEFYGEHPGLVVRAAQGLHSTCIIVPLTSRPQGENAKHVYQLSQNPNPQKRQLESWAICDHLYTININRLRPFKGRNGGNVFPKASQADLQGIFATIRKALHHVFLDPQPPAPTPSAGALAPARLPGPNTLILGAKRPTKAE